MKQELAIKYEQAIVLSDNYSSEGDRSTELQLIATAIKPYGWTIPEIIKTISIEEASELIELTTKWGLERRSCFQSSDIKELKIISEEEFKEIPQRLMSSILPLGTEARGDLLWFLENYKDIPQPKSVPSKETLCLLLKERPDWGVDLVSTVNDLLRLSIYSMGGDPELPTKCKIGKLRLGRGDRKWILQLIENYIAKTNVDTCVIDAQRFLGHWLMIGKILHPGDFVNKFPRSYILFHSLRDKESRKQFKTWTSKLQSLYDTGTSLEELIKFISKRPGEFVRRFDSLLRRCMKENSPEDAAASLFATMLKTSNMSTKTLLSLCNHFEIRDKVDSRVVILKSGKVKEINKHEPLPDYILESVIENIEEKVLKNVQEVVTSKDLVGERVIIDSKLLDIPLPKNLRDSEMSSIPVGTRIPLDPKAEVFRFYVHWVQKERDEDLDLHAYMYDPINKQSFNCGFNTGFDQMNSLIGHSGDVLNRDGDCTEYVDLKISDLNNGGWKYAVMDIINFKERPISSVETYLGYNTRKNVEAGNKIWTPTGIEEWSLAVDSMSCTAMIVDLEKRDLIFLGIPKNKSTYGENQNKYLDRIISFFTAERNTINLGKILETHYIARGANVEFGNKPVPKVIEKENEVEIIESTEKYISVGEIVSDFTKVLPMLG